MGEKRGRTKAVRQFVKDNVFVPSGLASEKFNQALVVAVNIAKCPHSAILVDAQCEVG